MKRNALFLSLLVLASLMISWSSAQALDYQVYRMSAQHSSAAKLASISQTPPDVPIVDYTVTDPAHDSTITTINVGDRTTIAAGERVYLPSGIYNLLSIGDVAEVYYGPGVKIHNTPGTKLHIGGPLGLTQLLGPGQDHKTVGIVVSGDVEIENTILAGHGYDVGLSHQNGNIDFQANSLYVTNSQHGILDIVGVIDNNDVIQLNIQNAVFWKNSRSDLDFYNLTKGHITLRAENCSFLSKPIDGNYSYPSVGFDSDDDDPNKLKYTAEFIDCVFYYSHWTWVPGEETTWTQRNQNDGVVKVWETRPGRNELVQVWPLTGPIDPADFDVNDRVDIADFRYLLTDFGKAAEESPFVRFYHLDQKGRPSLNGPVDLRDIKLWTQKFLGFPDAYITPETMADSLANSLRGKELLKTAAKFPAVVEAILADPVLGPVLENYLKPTAVMEEAVAAPASFALNQNYPNPFNPATTINFSLPERTVVEVEIYNLAGQSVKTLLADTLPAGSHQLQWDGAGDNGQAVASGLYVCALRAGSVILTQKMTLLR